VGVNEITAISHMVRPICIIFNARDVHKNLLSTIEFLEDWYKGSSTSLRKVNEFRFACFTFMSRFG